MQEGKEQTTQTEQVSESKPVKRRTAKKVVAPKQRYFVPALGRQVEASNLNEVAEIVKKETKR